MKIRKSVLKQDLRDMPIDHGDMFLMSQAEDLIDVSEVAEIVPWEVEETERRLAALVELGLLEWVDERGEPIDRVKRDTLPNFYVAVTLRPKAPEPVAELFRQTETSVVALRALDGLLFLDQAVIHNDRSVFARATLVAEKAGPSDGPVFATARPPSLNEQDLHFSLPPLTGSMAAVPPALAAPVRAMPPAAPEAPVHFSLPPFFGAEPQAAPSLLRAAPQDTDDELISFSLPPFPDDAAAEEPSFLSRSTCAYDKRDVSGTLSLPPFPDEEGHEPLFLPGATPVRPAAMAAAIRFTQPGFVGEKRPQPAVMARATRVQEHEPAAVFSRATVPGERPAEPGGMARGTLVYEKAKGPSVYERTTVVDEDAEQRSVQFEQTTTSRRGGSNRR